MTQKKKTHLVPKVQKLTMKEKQTCKLPKIKNGNQKIESKTNVLGEKPSPYDLKTSNNILRKNFNLEIVVLEPD